MNTESAYSKPFTPSHRRKKDKLLVEVTGEISPDKLLVKVRLPHKTITTVLDQDYFLNAYFPL